MMKNMRFCNVCLRDSNCYLRTKCGFYGEYVTDPILVLNNYLREYIKQIPTVGKTYDEFTQYQLVRNIFNYIYSEKRKSTVEGVLYIINKNKFLLEEGLIDYANLVEEVTTHCEESIKQVSGC